MRSASFLHMPYNEVPRWMLDAVRVAEEQRRFAEPYAERALETAEIVESMMPAFRYAQQYAEQRRQVVEMARSMAPIVEFMERHAEQVKQALAAAEVLFGYFDQTALAMTADTTAPQTWTASADLVAKPTLTVEAEVVETTDSGDVDVQPDNRPDTRRPTDYAAMAIKLLWAWALIAPPYLVLLTSTEQQVLKLVRPDHHARVDDHLAVQRQPQALKPVPQTVIADNQPDGGQRSASFYIVDNNEVPEEDRRAAEDAGEMVRFTRPAAEAAAQAADAVRSLTDLQTVQIRSVSAMLAAQTDLLMRPPADLEAAQIRSLGTSVSAMLAAQTDYLVRPLVDLEAAQIRSLGTSVSAMLAAQTDYLVRPLVDLQVSQLGEMLRSAAGAILAAQQYSDLAHATKALAAGPWSAYAGQIALASDAGLAQLATSWNQTTGSGFTTTSVFKANTDVVKTPENPDELARRDADTDQGRKINAAAFAVVLVWVVALTMPAAQELLAPEAQQMINSYAGMIALALIITWRIDDNRKR